MHWNTTLACWYASASNCWWRLPRYSRKFTSAHPGSASSVPSAPVLPGGITQCRVFDPRDEPQRNGILHDDRRGGPDDAIKTDDPVDHPLEIGVGAGHEAAQHVPGTGGGVQLQHLRHGRQVGPDIGAFTLPDLQRGERRDRVAEGRWVHLRTESADDSVRLKPVQPRLHRAPGDPQPARP